MDSDHFQQALMHCSLGANNAALYHLEQQDLSSVQSHILRAQILISLGQPQKALDVLESLLHEGGHGASQQVQLQILAARAYFANQENEKAIIEVQKAKDLAEQIANEVEKKDYSQIINVLIRKVELELTNSSRVGNINDAAYLSSSKGNGALKDQPVAPVKKEVPIIDKKYDWYQNATHIFITYKVSSPEISSNAKVTFDSQSVTIEYQDVIIRLDLTNDIVPEESVSTATPKKIELKMKKHIENVNWMGVEKGGESKLLATQQITSNAPNVPSYPTSSKKKKNWDEIDRDINKEMANEKPEGDAALNSLFKQIYDRADEDTRRAMIKSYQTSGGTVLSTNWDEVAAKDYEGKDRPSAPDGQEWAKDH